MHSLRTADVPEKMKKVALCLGLAVSLLAVRARAQLDSNAVLRLYCGSITEGCEIVPVCQYGTGSPIYTSTTAGFDSSIRLADIARWGQNTYPWQELAFSIDSADTDIVGLTISKREDVHVNDGDGYVELSIRFPKIPFHYVDKVLELTPRRFECSAFVSSFCSYGMYNPCSGSCSTYDTLMDSVFFEITSSSDAVADPSQGNDFFRVTSMDGREVFSYNAALFERELRVFNLLGVTAFNIPVYSGQILTESDLPPGCYFARLGGEVAKFVVPPR